MSKGQHPQARKQPSNCPQVHTTVLSPACCPKEEKEEIVACQFLICGICKILFAPSKNLASKTAISGVIKDILNF